MEREEVEVFAKALIEVKDKVRKCSVCGNFSEEEINFTYDFIKKNCKSFKK